MIKDIITIVLMLLMVIGFGGAQISAIGVAIYDWAHDVELSMALWNGFVIWLKLMALGIISFVGVAILRGGDNE